MAAPLLDTTQCTADNFVESAGAIIFKVSTKEVCLVYGSDRDVWLLAKGRRNVGESRSAAALREAHEETGYSCKLLPVTMRSRCTPDTVETNATPDEPRIYEKVCEPFMLTHRVVPNAGIKLIYWFIGAIDEDEAPGRGEDRFNAKLFSFEEALKMLTYAPDREIVQTAIEIYQSSYGDTKSL